MEISVIEVIILIVAGDFICDLYEDGTKQLNLVLLLRIYSTRKRSTQLSDLESRTLCFVNEDVQHYGRGIVEIASISTICIIRIQMMLRSITLCFSPVT